MPNATYAFQAVGTVLLVYGLGVLSVRDVVAGIVILQCAKAWFLDRMVLLFEDVEASRPEWAGWEYSDAAEGPGFTGPGRGGRGP